MERLLFSVYFGVRIERSRGLFWNKEERVKLQMTPRSLACVIDEWWCPVLREKRGRTGLRGR